MLTNRNTLALAEALGAAARAGIVETSGDTLSFRHELIHDALYQDWPLPVRRSLHRDVGMRLAASGAPAWRVAHHLSLGAEPGDAAAVEWLHRAGLAAAPRDPAAAVSLLGRAAELAVAARTSATSSAPTCPSRSGGLARPTRGSNSRPHSWPRLSTWPCAAAPPPGWRLPCWFAGSRRRLVACATGR